LKLGRQEKWTRRKISAVKKKPNGKGANSLRRGEVSLYLQASSFIQREKKCEDVSSGGKSREARGKKPPHSVNKRGNERKGNERREPIDYKRILKEKKGSKWKLREKASRVLKLSSFPEGVLDFKEKSEGNECQRTQKRERAFRGTRRLPKGVIGFRRERTYAKKRPVTKLPDQHTPGEGRRYLLSTGLRVTGLRESKFKESADMDLLN